MWGLPFNPLDSEGSGLRRKWQSWMSLAMGNPREVYLNPYEYSDHEMRRFVERLVRFQPDVLLGYTNSLYFLAKHVQAAGIRSIRPRGIICGGEPLHPEGRLLLESVFHSKVFLRYGSREADIIASECQHGRMHVNDDNLLVELLTDPGEVFGKVLVTDLWNFAMPLIRYDLEDFASWADGTCPCGRGLSILAGIEGRRSEMFRTQDGRMVSGLWFTSFMREIPELKRYQVHQTGYRTFRIRIVTDPNLPPEEVLRPAISQIRSRFGEDTSIEIIRETEIKQVGTGKFRFLISDPN
jgi:phenylacetate-CoA ligase